MGNAQRAPDAGLATKLTPLARALADADRAVQQACAQLDAMDWSVQALTRESDNDPPDNLDQLIAVARSLTEDVRRAASFLQGNAPLLFRKDTVRKIPVDENDYASVDGVRDLLPADMQPIYEAALNDTADTDDSRLLKFYAALALNHITHLTEAIDAFLLTVEHNQPPKIFLGMLFMSLVQKIFL